MRFGSRPLSLLAVLALAGCDLFHPREIAIIQDSPYDPESSSYMGSVAISPSGTVTVDNPTFEWSASALAGATYRLEVATDASFTGLVVTDAGLTGTTHQSATRLANHTHLYWRVAVVAAAGSEVLSPALEIDTVIPNRAVFFAAGRGHAAAIKRDGSLWTMGDNSLGYLGDGTTVSPTAPVKIMEGVKHVQQTPGSWLDHEAQTAFYVLKQDGTLWTWGFNPRGLLGNGGSTNTTVPAQVMDHVASVAAGNNHVLVAKTDGTVWAWGSNASGQLGTGELVDHLLPVQVLLSASPAQAMTEVVSVAVEDTYSTAVRSDGTLWAWGRDTAAPGFVLLPVQITSVTNAVSVVGDQNHTYVLTSGGVLYAWGSNHEGQLGNGSNDAADHPVQVIENIAAFASFSFHAYAVTTGGDLYLWGNHTVLTPTLIAHGVVAAFCGIWDDFYIKTDGTIEGNGYNGNGELGATGIPGAGYGTWVDVTSYWQ